MRHELITKEYIRFYDKGIMYIVNTCGRLNDYMLPCGHILYAHSKDLIRGGVSPHFQKNLIFISTK